MKSEQMEADFTSHEFQNKKAEAQKLSNFFRKEYYVSWIAKTKKWAISNTPLSKEHCEITPQFETKGRR